MERYADSLTSHKVPRLWGDCAERRSFGGGLSPSEREILEQEDETVPPLLLAPSLWRGGTMHIPPRSFIATCFSLPILLLNETTHNETEIYYPTQAGSLGTSLAPRCKGSGVLWTAHARGIAIRCGAVHAQGNQRTPVRGGVGDRLARL